VAFGQAQHLAAERGQPAIVAVKLIDQIFDLGAVELDALHFRRQLLAQRLILLLVRLRELLAGAHRLHARALQLGEIS
jgi:hypothetical protein